MLERACEDATRSEAFQTAANGAKDTCPISRLLKPGAQITLSARLE